MVPTKAYATHVAQLITKLNTEEEVAELLLDLMTHSELETVDNRLNIAYLLMRENMSYQQIAAKIDTSTTTVTRVNAALNISGTGTLRKVLSQ